MYNLRLSNWFSCFAGVALFSLPVSTVAGEDWPAYRHDAARSGITAEKIKPPLVQSWVFQSRHAPQPAWGKPKSRPIEDILELPRNRFDDVFQPVAAGGAVYFGSSAENKVFCLDAATGKIRWTKILGGPIRLAPTIADGRAYVACDDGYAYCLSAKDGSVVWKFHAAPEDRRVLGNGKMISLWPLRTGIVVDDGIAYFSAGIFPAEGVFFYAVDAADGREIWRNDTCGEPAMSRVSPQGYLLASKTTLYAPLGRCSPAALRRSDGTLISEGPFFGKRVGGAYALLVGDDVYTGTEEITAYHGQKQDRFAKFAGRKMVVAGDTAYLANNTQLMAMDRGSKPKIRWKVNCPCHDELILAGNILLAGGKDQVVAVNAADGKQLWTAKVDGAAKGLAVAGGRLIVSTDKGLIYSFGPKGTAEHGTISETTVKDPYAKSPKHNHFREMAKGILEMAETDRGYCLVWHFNTGQLLYELAEQSDMTVYGVSPDAKKVAAVRKTIDAAGLYGRVCVEQQPPHGIPYPNYFANLIVMGDIWDWDKPSKQRQRPHLRRLCDLVKPLGGKMLFESHFARSLPEERDYGSYTTTGYLFGLAELTRGQLPGAGSWTHQYSTPANVASSDDKLVKAPFGVLWFGRPGPERMANRHTRAAAPLYLDGRFFVQGEDCVLAYDAYNGLKLWEREIPNPISYRPVASHDMSTLALSKEALFVTVADKCLKLDPATGQLKATFHVPKAKDGKPRRWGYVAYVEGLLYGSRTPARYESDMVFAMNPDTGEVVWIYEGVKISHGTITIGDGWVFLLSSSATEEDRKRAIEERRKQIEKLPEKERARALADLQKADIRMVVALDTKTGNLKWQRPVDVSRLPGKSKSGSKEQAAMYNDGVLVLFGVYLDGHHWKEFFAGEFNARRVTAISAADGKLLWDKQIGYRVRPLIVGDTLHAEPWAFDLHTGQQRMRPHPVTGAEEAWQFARPGHHCGCPAASPHCLFFRSWCLGYYDLDGDYGIMHFGAQRPGCWINFLPVGGLLLMPEASAGCMCAFPNMCTVVFEPTERQKAWAWYSAPGPMTPVKRLAINFGALGDRKDPGGGLWLGYPRPYKGRLVMDLKVDASFHPGGKFATGNSVYTKTGKTDIPWLYSSDARGLRKCTIPLLGRDDGASQYSVRLAFADPENDKPGQRVFDIKLQGNVLAKDFDIVKEAGGQNRAVLREFDGIEVDDRLTIELIPKVGVDPKGPGPESSQEPILCGVEIVREGVVKLGCSLPDFVTSSLMPSPSAELKLSNLRDNTIECKVQLAAPKGFTVSPKQKDVELGSGKRMALPVELKVADDVAAGDYPLTIKLVRGDGSVELEKSVRIKHLGRRGRAVLQPVEDAYVHQKYPNRNKGAADVLLLDGGDRKMGDRDHAQFFLKFRVDVHGKPVSAVLRLTNAGNPTSNSGRVCRAEGAWSEKKLLYQGRPKVGKELARLGPVREHQVVEVPLDVKLDPKCELDLVIDPVNCDGVTYISREGAKPPELIVEFEPTGE